MSALRAFDTLIDVVLAIDSELGLRYGNGPASELLEASVKRLAGGKPLAQWLELKGAGFDLADLVKATEATPYREVQYATSAGREGWAQVSAQPLPPEIAGEGSPPLCLLFFRDVSLEKTLHEKYRAELDQKEAVIDDLKAARAQLEDYSKNLEKMVEARTRELREANGLLRAVLDSLGQGIVVFNAAGQLLPMHSKVAEKLFEKSPKGATAASLLGLDAAAAASFARWVDALFSDMLSFEDLAPLGPSRYAHSGGRSIALSFNEMRAGSALEGVVMIATDRTDEMRALADAERERRFARMVTLVAGHRQQFRAFAAEAKQLLAGLEAACRSQGPFPEEETTRWLHTLKGGAASFALDDVARAAHECESTVVDRKAAHAGDLAAAFSGDFRATLLESVAGIRGRFESFLEKHSELFGGLRGDGGRVVEVPVAALSAWARQLESLPQVREIREAICRDYVQEPIANSFLHLESSMQELAASLGKSLAPLSFVGGELAIVPEQWAELFSTFIHAFRNSVDHGLETAAERGEAGKPESGKIEARFARFERGGRPWLRVEIADDGRGIDPAKIRAKLVSKGMAAWAEGKSDHDVIQAVFLDDLSTAEKATEVSGRGVGLSAIKGQAQAMGGDAHVESELGKGSRTIVEVPEPVDGAAVLRVA